MKNPKYWQALEELEQSPEVLEQAKKEFPSPLPQNQSLEDISDRAEGWESDRRDFLKTLGFGVTAATLSACVEAPTRKAIPYVNKPDVVIPGVANLYASSTPDGIPVLVRAREGRPIKLDGNPDSKLTGGGLSAVGQAHVLNLYDVDRLKSPIKEGNPSTWDVVDREISDALASIKEKGGQVRLLSHTLNSPSTKAIIRQFLDSFEGNAQHVTYDPGSLSAVADSHEIDFGIRHVPSYYFEKAKVVVSFSCDFMGTWGNTVANTANYGKLRDPDAEVMSRHLQFESLMSLTGANADLRFPIRPSEEGLALLNLYNKIARKKGKPTLPSIPQFNVAMNGLDIAVNDLLNAQGESIVICGTNNIAVQQVVNAINEMLGNYEKTIVLSNPSHIREGSDQQFMTLVQELERGEVDALIILDGNPAYDTPLKERFKSAIDNVGLSVALPEKVDETSTLCTYSCPKSHFLETWGDRSLTPTSVSIVQPTINPIFNTRQLEDSLIKWGRLETKSFKDFLQSYWEERFYSVNEVGGNYVNFRQFWNESLRKGVLELPLDAGSSEYSNGSDLIEISQVVLNQLKNVDEGLQLIMYQKVGIRDGKYANNPWLQELPDPISRTTWDNYLTISYAYAQENNLKLGDVVSLSVGDQSIKVPVLVQPGQANGTLGLALGYGRKEGGKVIAITGGVDAYPFMSFEEGTFQYARIAGVSLEKTNETYKIARTQTFSTFYDEGTNQSYVPGFIRGEYDRSEHIVKETSLAYYKSDDKNNPYRKAQAKYQEKKKHLVSLWDSYFEDPESKRKIHWTMAIDLSKCTGCGACVVSCHAENNVPVVGKQEVLNRREMHWLRIDRYYSGDPNNPDVAFQPMMCQHCDNAPCETVCPVLATIHSDEGLNQMTYNRCVGTRYCANNCPYKVRRFNWFSYPYNEKFKTVNPAQGEYSRLVLNPDVTVRWRGVMEKCSFCVQRLQDAKLKAKLKANSSFAKPKDGDVYTACQSACTAGAIVFGDRNDPESAVYKAMIHERSYLALEEVKTLPSVNYMTLVRNRTEEEALAKEKAVMKSSGREVPASHEEDGHA
ncbi:MAG: TAT-variant-translocated molybdopterin oxidoreductase [Bacteroidota bacterium]